MKCPQCDFDYPSDSLFCDKHEIKGYFSDAKFKEILKEIGLEE